MHFIVFFLCLGMLNKDDDGSANSSTYEIFASLERYSMSRSVGELAPPCLVDSVGFSLQRLDAYCICGAESVVPVRWWTSAAMAPLCIHAPAMLCTSRRLSCPMLASGFLTSSGFIFKWPKCWALPRPFAFLERPMYQPHCAVSSS